MVMIDISLGDIAEIITGPFGSQLHQSDYVDQGIPSIMPQNIGNRTLEYKDIARVSEEDAKRLARYAVKQDDIVYARRGDIEKHAYIRPHDEGALCGTGCMRIRVNPQKAVPAYVSFFLNRPESKKWISQHAVGTNMPNLNTEILSSVPVRLPCMEDQKRIVRILECLDSVLSYNNQLCSELESMAKILYDYWFVQFDFPDENGKPYRASGGKMVWNEQLKREIPEGWEVDNLYRIAEFINGLACQKYRPKDGEHGLPVVKIKEMHDGITDDTELVSQSIPEKNRIYDGDVLFSWSATLEVMYWFGGNAGLNQHIFKVVPRGAYAKEYVYEQLSAYVINFVKMAEARKTTMGHITTDHLEQSRIVIPKEELIPRFAEAVHPLHEKIGHAQRENRELRKIRDWLLPMLMNGQATVIDEPPAEQVLAFPAKQPQQFTVKQSARSYSPNEKRKDDTADLLRFYMERKK